MRINDAYKNPQVTPASVKSAGTAAAKGQGGAATNAVGTGSEDGKESVSVSISTRARELASVNAGIDHAKVERLKAQVDSGQFTVDPQKVANGIVNESSS